MDVHAPHKPIHSIKEFLVHLLAITIGLLIALGLEASVECVHHRHLAQEARENILQEIRDNQKSDVEYLQTLPAIRKALELNRDVVDDELHGRPIKPLDKFSWSNLRFQDSAWNAAYSSGAITFMNYDEVKRYEKIYNTQKLIASFMERHIDDRIDVRIFLQRMEAGDKLSKDELESGKQTLERMLWLEFAYDESSHTLNDNLYTKLLAQVK